MKNSISLLCFAMLILFSGFKSLETTSNWNLGSEHEIKFSSNEPNGIFKTLSGKVIFDEDNLEESSFNMTVDVKSINTGKGAQNKHAVSDKWFDAEKYPSITFESSKIENSNDNFEVTGNLQIKDVTKEISFPFTFENNTFSGSFDVDRLDYNIGNMKGMNKNASQIIKVELSIPVAK